MIVKFVSRHKWLSSYMMLHEIRSIYIIYVLYMYRFGLGWMWWLGPQHESSGAFIPLLDPRQLVVSMPQRPTMRIARPVAWDVWQVEEVELKVKLIPFLESSRDRMFDVDWMFVCLIVCFFVYNTIYKIYRICFHITNKEITWLRSRILKGVYD